MCCAHLFLFFVCLNWTLLGGAPRWETNAREVGLEEVGLAGLLDKTAVAAVYDKTLTQDTHKYTFICESVVSFCLKFIFAQRPENFFLKAKKLNALAQLRSELARFFGRVVCNQIASKDDVRRAPLPTNLPRCRP